MELKKIHGVGILIGILVIIISYFLAGENLFFFLVGIGILISTVPFVFTVMREANIALEKEEMFVEFTRNLFESVSTGIPVSRSIINVKNKPYGVLSKHIKKLANQIYLGIPIITALQNFSRDSKNKLVSRTITLIGQAEKSGGDIGEILKSVADAVGTSDKLKKERKAAISTFVVQGYIIFFVFIVIVLVLQFRLIPLIFNLGVGSITSAGEVTGGGAINVLEISNSFLWLLITQGLFSGLVIGEISEQNLKAGVKHSFVLIIMAFFISSGARLLLG
jgi:flagellar protein FlaJ